MQSHSQELPVVT